MVKNPPANAGDVRDSGLIPGSGRFPGGGHGSPLQGSCLGHSMDRGAWWATAHGLAKSQTQLKRPSSSTGVIAADTAGSPASTQRPWPQLAS